jgi:hypothetical protein
MLVLQRREPSATACSSSSCTQLKRTHNETLHATQVLVASIGSGMQAKRMELASRLWEAGIAVRGCT